MPLIKLQFRPGVNRELTDYSNEGGWVECDKVRFRDGFAEKLRGWAKSTPLTFIGVCRQLMNWSTTFSDNLLALGTHEKLYIEVGGSFYDVTPLRSADPTMSTTETDNCIGTTSGSTTITVTLGAAHAAQSNNYVTISGVSGAVGGVAAAVLNANHKITVTSSTVFTFTVATTASSTTTGGGTAIDIDFEIDVGNPIPVGGYGWGTSTWGRQEWGLGSDAPVQQPQQDWWLDNFDNDLVANIRDGPVYWWERGSTSSPTTALETRGISLQDYATANSFDPAFVPAKVMQIMVSQQDKHLIAFGAVPYTSTSAADFDPMLIRWASQDSPAEWEPLVTNSAGFLRISRGSKIVRAMPARQEILVWSDSNLFTLQFLGTTDVFGLQEYSDNISVASARSMASASNVIYWMGHDKFYMYTGRVETLSCTLREYVFGDLNYAQLDQIVCGTNEGNNEIWWFYPTEDSDFNNAYVVYNHKEQIWFPGTIDRTAWLDTSLRRYPVAANTSIAVDNQTSAVTVGSGYLYNHEYGLNDDEAAMTSYIQSSDFDIGDGDQFMLCRRVIPDVTFDESTADTPELTLQIRARNFPGSSLSSFNTDTQSIIETTVGEYTNQVFIRARARQMAFKIMSEDLGVQWRIGSNRLDVRSDGRKS